MSTSISLTTKQTALVEDMCEKELRTKFRDNDYLSKHEAEIDALLILMEQINKHTYQKYKERIEREKILTRGTTFDIGKMLFKDTPSEPYFYYVRSIVIGAKLNDVVSAALKLCQDDIEDFGRTFYNGEEKNNIVKFDAVTGYPGNISHFFSEQLPNAVVYSVYINERSGAHELSVQRNGENYGGFSVDRSYNDAEKQLFYDGQAILTDVNTGYKFTIHGDDVALEHTSTVDELEDPER